MSGESFLPDSFESHFFRCSFTFDPDNFPDPEAYLSDIKRKFNVKICVWSA